MSERRSTERLLADAEDRLRVSEDLPERIAQVRGWAEDEAGRLRVTVDVHGALDGLQLAPEALSMGAEQLGREIVALAGLAQQAALAEGIARLAPAIGDGASNQLARDVGLGHLVTDAPVVPYVPGIDPGASPDDGPPGFDFSAQRSDRPEPG